MTIPLQSGASEMGSTTERTTIDTSVVIATMTTMEETILSKGASTTAIANAIAGTPPDTTIANKTTTANTATAVATTEGSIAYQTRSARTATMKTKDTTIDTGAAIATTTEVTKKDTTIDTSADMTKDTTIDTGAVITTTTDVTTDNDKRKRGMLLESQAMIAKNAKTTMPEINNAATMTGTPIVATTSTSGSVANHGSSESVAENDLGQTTKGNKKVSIISDMFLFPKWN